MFTKLRNRLTIIFVLLTIIPLLLLSSVLGARSFAQSINDSLERQRLLNGRAGQAIEDLIGERVNELELLGNTNQFEQLSVDEQRGVISRLMRQQAYNDVSIVAPDGQERLRMSLFRTVSDADLINYAQNPLFQATTKAAQVNYSDVFFDDQTGEPLLTIAMPFYSQRSGALSYMIFANFRFHLIWDLIGKLETQNRGSLHIFLTDASGTVVAHANPTIVFQKRVYGVPAADGQAAGLDGSDSLVTVQNVSLSNLQFKIIAEESIEAAFKNAQDLALSAAIITVLTMIAAIAVILAVARQIVRPIEQLSQVADAIRGGDLNAQASVQRTDEIGKMGQAFNSMTAQLRQTLTGLQKHVDDLEKARVERENLIKDLQAAKRLAEENSRLKSEFLSTMSHELRTPLNAIEGFTGIVLSKLGGTDFNSKTESYLVRVRSNSKRLLQLINDFLDLSRVEAGRLQLANQPFSPSQLAKRWEEEISVLAEKKGIQFNISVDSALPPTLLGDEEAISKIALNLLGNAIKFTEQGEIKLVLQRTDGVWDISVQDTGIGIPPHAREFIFEEFRQVDQSSKRKYGGTGLGLAIVQKYARAMGGTVQVRSEVGKGSTFTVSLPLNAQA